MARTRAHSNDDKSDSSLFSDLNVKAKNSAKLILMTFAGIAVLSYLAYVFLKEASKKSMSKEAMRAREGFVVGKTDEIGVPALRTDVTPRPLALSDANKNVLLGNKQSNLISRLAKETKGDGVLRDVNVDGQRVSRELVQQAMFDNADYAPRTDQFPLVAHKLSTDTTTRKQRDFFAPPSQGRQ